MLSSARAARATAEAQAAAAPAAVARASRKRGAAALVAPAPAGGSMLAHPAGPPPRSRTTMGGVVHPGNLGIRSVNPRGEKEFEPVVGPAGNFAQVRKFHFPNPKPGDVVVQQVTRQFNGVRRGPPGSAKPVLDARAIDSMVAKDSVTHAQQEKYFEMFEVPPAKRHKPGAAGPADSSMEDTLGLPGIVPPMARGTRKADRANDTTSGAFTVSTDARLFRRGAATLKKKYGFRKQPEETSPANGLPERPAGKHRRGRTEYPALNSMDDITEPHDGQVTHELHGEWNTFHPGVHTPSAREALNWTRLRANKTKTWDETKKRWA